MKNDHSAPKGKEKTDKAGAFAKGGTTKMRPQMGVQPMPSGVAAQPSPPSTGNNPLKGGGSGVMGKQGGAAASESGKASMGGRPGDNNFKVSGGKTHMFGNTGSQPAKAK